MGIRGIREKVDQYRTITHSWDLGSLKLWWCCSRSKRENMGGTAKKKKKHHFSDQKSTRPARPQAIFFGLGSDGTVGANKAAAAIIGERTEFYSQAPGWKNGVCRAFQEIFVGWTMVVFWCFFGGTSLVQWWVHVNVCEWISGQKVWITKQTFWFNGTLCLKDLNDSTN